jgi:hypothetical protein
MAAVRANHVAAVLVVVATAAGIAWLINAPTGTPDVGPSRAAEHARPEVLSVEPQALDMGDLVPRHPVTRTVVLRNVVDRAIRVQSAIASCGCTTSTWPTEPIPPGGTAEAQVTMEAGDSQGERMVKQVTYLPEGGAPAVLTVSGLVGTFVGCEPRIVDEPAPGTAQLPAEIVIESLDGTQFRVDSVDPDVAILPEPDVPGLRHVVRIDWARWRVQGRPMHLSIELDHPKSPKLGIVMRRAIAQ